VLLDNNMTGYL